VHYLHKNKSVPGSGSQSRLTDYHMQLKRVKPVQNVNWPTI